MDPAIIFFGLGVGFLVGMTGMGGGSLMTPLLVLVFGIKPTTAIGTDIFYAAITKTAGSWRHLKLKTVNLPLVYWMAAGSVPSAIAGVWFLDYLKRRLGDNLDETVFAILAGCLLVVGAATLLRGLFLADKIQEREDFEMHTRHKVAAVAIGATTGFVIGLSSAGSGTLIGIMLIAVYRLTPRKVVGTDVVHAAILLWAASIAHIFSGNVDFGLAANILVGSVPGVIIGSNLSVKCATGRSPLRPRIRPDRRRRHDHEQGEHGPRSLGRRRRDPRGRRPLRRPARPCARRSSTTPRSRPSWNGTRGSSTSLRDAHRPGPGPLRLPPRTNGLRPSLPQWSGPVAA